MTFVDRKVIYQEIEKSRNSKVVALVTSDRRGMEAQIAQDAIAREYHLEVPRLLTFLGAAMALTAQGLEPSDRAVLTDLTGVRENELIDVSSLLEVAGDTIEELDSPAGHDLLALLRRPFDREIERRAARAVQQ